MFGSALKAKAEALALPSGTRYLVIQKLVLEGVFDTPKSSAQVVLTISETFGERWRTIHVQTYMKKFMQAGIIRAVRPPNGRHNHWVLSCVTKAEAISLIGRGRKAAELESELFSADLVTQLQKNFQDELGELHDNFGKNGNCTAFLLRKILEKLIIISVSKAGSGDLLKDPSRPGGWKGLRDLIEVASREKIGGLPILVPKTATEVKGVKFLGDTAAHNPLVGVDMASIIPQMPFIITAYKELANRL